MLNRKEREELKVLSKEILGSSSRWKKFTEKGYTELVTQEVEEPVHPEKEGDPTTIRKVKVPLKTAFGANQYVTKYHTEESIKEWLLEQKKTLENIRAQFKKNQEEAKAKKEAEELAKKVHEVGSGTAV